MLEVGLLQIAHLRSGYGLADVAVDAGQVAGRLQVADVAVEVQHGRAGTRAWSQVAWDSDNPTFDAWHAFEVDPLREIRLTVWRVMPSAAGSGLWESRERIGEVQIPLTLHQQGTESNGWHRVVDAEGTCQGEVEVSTGLVSKKDYRTACLKVTVFSARDLQVRDLFNGVLGYPYATVRHGKQKRRGHTERNDDIKELERCANCPTWGFQTAVTFRPHEDVVVDIFAEERRGFQAETDPFLGRANIPARSMVRAMGEKHRGWFTLVDRELGMSTGVGGEVPF